MWFIVSSNTTSTAQHSEHSTAQHRAAQRRTAQHSTAQRSAAQHSAAQRSKAQQHHMFALTETIDQILTPPSQEHSHMTRLICSEISLGCRGIITRPRTTQYDKVEYSTTQLCKVSAAVRRGQDKAGHSRAESRAGHSRSMKSTPEVPWL